jgi:hypothetical protein
MLAFGMTKLDALIARARALPPEEQDALAGEMEVFLDGPALTQDDAEVVVRRLRAFDATPERGLSVDEARDFLAARR